MVGEPKHSLTTTNVKKNHSCFGKLYFSSKANITIYVVFPILTSFNQTRDILNATVKSSEYVYTFLHQGLACKTSTKQGYQFN